MKFNTEIIGCYWQEDKGEWLVKLRENKPGQEPREFEDHCHVLLHVSLSPKRSPASTDTNLADTSNRALDFSITTNGQKSPVFRTNLKAK